jgi:CheY-like chemotaxis protein
MEGAGSRVVVAAVADLIFGARIRAAADAAGVELRLARKPSEVAELAAGAELVIIDLDARWLDAPESIRAVRAAARATAAAERSAPRVIAYGSHVQAAALAAARAAGADRVMARSAFVRELPALLSG